MQFTKFKLLGIYQTCSNYEFAYHSLFLFFDNKCDQSSSTKTKIFATFKFLILKLSAKTSNYTDQVIAQQSTNQNILFREKRWMLITIHWLTNNRMICVNEIVCKYYCWEQFQRSIRSYNNKLTSTNIIGLERTIIICLN